MLIKKMFILIIIMFLGLITVSCSNSNLGNDSLAITEEYAGSGGPGDFYQVDINLTNMSYSFKNLTTQSDTGNGNFDVVNKTGETAIYRLDTGDIFAKLSDNMVVVADNNGNPGERLTVALKKSNENFGNLIEGTYNLATSMEGAIGEVIVSPDTNTVDIYLDMNGDGDYVDNDTETVDDILLDLPYSYNTTYNAIELIESNSFKHYGVYFNNELAVWDSYFWNGTTWQGDGMSVMVKQDKVVDLNEYEGQYYYIDVDGDYGSFKLVYIDVNDPKLDMKVEGETIISITQSNVDDRGIINFEADLGNDDGKVERWHMMGLPGSAIILSSTDNLAFEGDGGIVVGIKKIK